MSEKEVQDFLSSQQNQEINLIRYTSNFENITPQTSVNFTDQILRLLNEDVEKKMNWEHDRVLLSQEDPQYSNSEPFCGTELFPQPQQSLKEACEDKRIKIVKNESEQHDQKISLVKEIGQEKQEEAKKTKNNGCHCQKASCLFRYCKCFRNGKQCSDCGCTDCKNNSSHKEERERAIKKVIERTPSAFEETEQYKGCQCTKNQCMQGYCPCFSEGNVCGKYCKCKACLNRLQKKTRVRKAKNEDS